MFTIVVSTTNTQYSPDGYLGCEHMGTVARVVKNEDDFDGEAGPHLTKRAQTSSALCLLDDGASHHMHNHPTFSSSSSCLPSRVSLRPETESSNTHWIHVAPLCKFLGMYTRFERTDMLVYKSKSTILCSATVHSPYNLRILDHLYVQSPILY